jgi:hypothetical protein
MKLPRPGRERFWPAWLASISTVRCGKLDQSSFLFKMTEVLS